MLSDGTAAGNHPRLMLRKWSHSSGGKPGSHPTRSSSSCFGSICLNPETINANFASNSLLAKTINANFANNSLRVAFERWQTRISPDQVTDQLLRIYLPEH
jgi:hypothetical protein